MSGAYGDAWAAPKTGVAVRLRDGSLLVKEVTGTGEEGRTVTFVAPFADPGTILLGGDTKNLLDADLQVTTGPLGTEYRRQILFGIEFKSVQSATVTFVDEAPELFNYNYVLGDLLTSDVLIGNMTDAGGLASAFDGVINEGWATSAKRVGGTDAYAGLEVNARIFKGVFYGTNNEGYIGNGVNPSITLGMYGKNGSAPASSTDGTLLGSLTFTDTSNESGNPREIVSLDNVTIWKYGWLRTSTASAQHFHLAEAQFYKSIIAY